MAESELKSAAHSSDAQVRLSASGLLRAIEPAPVRPLPYHGHGAEPVHVKPEWRAAQQQRADELQMKLFRSPK